MPRPSNDLARQHEDAAWALRRQCLTEAEIAEKLGISQPAVSKILKRVEDRVLKSLAREIGREKARQTSQLDWVAAEAARAWARSLGDAVTVKQTDTPIGPEGGDGDRTETTVKGQSGNPALLAQLRGALADVRAIWGLNAPKKLELDVSGLTDDELLKQATAALGRGGPSGPDPAESRR